MNLFERIGFVGGFMHLDLLFFGLSDLGESEMHAARTTANRF